MDEKDGILCFHEIRRVLRELHRSLPPLLDSRICYEVCLRIYVFHHRPKHREARSYFGFIDFQSLAVNN